MPRKRLLFRLFYFGKRPGQVWASLGWAALVWACLGWSALGLANAGLFWLIQCTNDAKYCLGCRASSYGCFYSSLFED